MASRPSLGCATSFWLVKEDEGLETAVGGPRTGGGSKILDLSEVIRPASGPECGVAVFDLGLEAATSSLQKNLAHPSDGLEANRCFSANSHPTPGLPTGR